MSELWTWREAVVVGRPNRSTTSPISGTDVTGFDVEASDGHIGKIDEATYDVGGSYVVVDTGFWIFGKKRMIPARVIESVDPDEEKVFLRITKDDVKEAPDYDPDRGFGNQRVPHDDYYSSTASNRR